MDKNGRIGRRVIFGAAANVAAFVFLAALGAPAWILWVLLALTVPYAVLGALLVIDRVRR